ncbi:MAG: hypothetical protein FJ012_01620 [Chloroflexi bacterium]|nr:hypothetical protein [Chloroflexota bacterium]
MAKSMPVDDWLVVLSQEYLGDFIKGGGAAVKFVVPLEWREHKVVLSKLRQVAEDSGYLFASVDAATTKAHMIDKIFHTVARQVNWEDLVCSFLCSTLSESHYLVPASRADLGLSQLALLNGLEVGEMRRVVNNRLRDRLYKDYHMTQEFRMAMLRLCQTQLDPQDVGIGTAEAVREWLRGELRLISALKSASIFQKIGRHNGRHMLFSLSHWLHAAGKTGLVITLDISRFLEARRPKEPNGTIYYSGPGVLDGYEVLRQFVDGTDELQFCLMIVLAPPDFLAPEADKRGLSAYQALKLRIWDEVRDQQRPNPLSSLVRLSGQATTVILQSTGGSL